MFRKRTKKPYESPNVNIILFEFSDIVTSSVGSEEPDNENVNGDYWG